ncbi:MAG: hypothetical protein U5K32_04025 [Bacteroidales bacterium]|nr:hypothetical protein [Bacteroidales bacterium]
MVTDYRQQQNGKPERTSWSSNDAAGAYASPLKLPLAGDRYTSDGSLFNVGSYG